MKKVLLAALLVLMVVFVMTAPAFAYDAGEPDPCEGGQVTDGYGYHASGSRVSGAKSSPNWSGERCLD